MLHHLLESLEHRHMLQRTHAFDRPGKEHLLNGDRRVPVRHVRPSSVARTVALLAAVTTTGVLGAQKAAPARPEDPAAEVRGLEDELTIAFNKYDATSLSRLWDDDLTFVFPNGAQAGKAERLADLKEIPAEIPQSVNESVQVKTFGTVAVAIVVSKWPGTRDGKPYSMRFRATHVWAKRGDVWRLVSAHVSLIKE